MPAPQSSASSAVRQARAALAERLRELRLDAGITGRELARRCGWSESKTSRIENLRTAPSDADIRAWCAACGEERQAADLIAANRQIGSMYVEWRRLQRTGLRRLQESTIGLYQRTRCQRVYCSSVVPGFFQTAEYATALLGSISAFRRLPDDVADAVRARLRRSAVVREPGHRFATLIEETVLRYRIGDDATMTEQLAHLRSVMSLPSVSLGVIPAHAARHRGMWPLENFSIFDEHEVHVETLSAALTITAPGEVGQYVRAFEELSRLAVFGAEARTLIDRAGALLEGGDE